MDKTGRSREYITAEHYTTARGWAEERGFLYLAAKNQEQLDEAMLTFTQEVVGMQPILLEVFTDKETDTRLLHEYYHSLRVEN
jgi:2-succinyl-5-enolpyruvyl-6-hydroxy-3-cyclohexene-1-carboxylate synthase